MADRFCEVCQRYRPASHFYSTSGKPRCTPFLKWPLHRRFRVAELINRGYNNARIARDLDTTETAVKLMRKRYKLEPVVAHKLTARETARIMGVGCAKRVVRWINEGWLDGTQGYRQGRHRIWLIERVDLYGFVENEAAWHVWEPDRITDRHLRDYAMRVRGHVRYLTPGEVAERMYCQITTVNQWIHKGWLPARKWGNWRIDERDLARFELPRIGGWRHREAA